MRDTFTLSFNTTILPNRNSFLYAFSTFFPLAVFVGVMWFKRIVSNAADEFDVTVLILAVSPVDTVSYFEWWARRDAMLRVHVHGSSANIDSNGNNATGAINKASNSATQKQLVSNEFHLQSHYILIMILLDQLPINYFICIFKTCELSRNNLNAINFVEHEISCFISSIT